MRSILIITLSAAAGLTIQCTSGGGPIRWVPDLDQAKWDDIEATADTAGLGTAFDLRVGGAAHLAGEHFWLVFADVPSDQRCPIGVECFWEGVASVRLWARQDAPDGAPGEPEELVVHTTDSGPFSRHVDYGEYTLTLDRLVPYPTAGEDGHGGPAVGRPRVPELGEYVLTLTVTRTGAGSRDAD